MAEKNKDGAQSLRDWEASGEGGRAERRYSFADYVEIIRRLRAPDGCPWDREQTHDSLRPCIVEETAELLAAVRILDKTGNPENLREELGDILLQVLMHAQIAAEDGQFTIDDVVNEAAHKMVYRHPHVFGQVEAASSDEVLANWDELKKKEKEGKTWVQGPLRDIPQELSALARAQKTLKKVHKLYDKEAGGLYADVARLAALTEDLKEVDAADTDAHVADVLGEMAMALADIAREKKLSLEEIVRDKTDALVEKYEPQGK